MEKELTLPWGKDGMTCALMMTVGQLYKIIEYYLLLGFFIQSKKTYMEYVKNPTIDVLIAQSILIFDI